MVLQPENQDVPGEKRVKLSVSCTLLRFGLLKNCILLTTLKVDHNFLLDIIIFSPLLPLLHQDEGICRKQPGEGNIILVVHSTSLS